MCMLHCTAGLPQLSRGSYSSSAGGAAAAQQAELQQLKSSVCRWLQDMQCCSSTLAMTTALLWHGNGAESTVQVYSAARPE
jgi:hypothetical protein